MSERLPPEIDLILSLIHDEIKRADEAVRRLEKILKRTMAAEANWRETHSAFQNCPFSTAMVSDNLKFAEKRLDLANSAWKKAAEVFGVPEWSIKG